MAGRVTRLARKNTVCLLFPVIKSNVSGEPGAFMQENVTNRKVLLPGSERKPLGERKGELPADAVIDISVILKPMERAAIPSTNGAPISREEFAARHGADPA